jgi:hypothetical protein
MGDGLPRNSRKMTLVERARETPAVMMKDKRI